MIPKEIPFKDRSEFLRGFLILIKKDHTVSRFEKNMALVIGKYFGFEEKFCIDSIESLLENEYISDKPPVFSSKSIAIYFINESKSILSQIHKLDANEIEWLNETAKINEIDY